MTPIDVDVILALLEEKPYSSAELAPFLEQSTIDVHKALLGLQREGRVKRVGIAQKWALPAYIAPAGHPPTIPRDQVAAAIRRVLAGTTLATEDLVLRTGINRHIIKDECAHMKARGELVSFGIGRGSRWKLPDAGVTPAQQPRHQRQGSASQSPDTDVTPDDVEEEDRHAVDLADPVDDEPPPRRPVPPRPRLRQVVPVAERYKNAGPSWWCAAPRDGFSAQAREHQERMRGSKENMNVRVRILE